jgi:hypothetical protein
LPIASLVRPTTHRTPADFNLGGEQYTRYDAQESGVTTTT